MTDQDKTETVDVGRATSRGYCYTCPTPIEVDDLWRRERVGDSVPHEFRLVHHPQCPVPDTEISVADAGRTTPAAAAQVWLTYFEPSSFGRHRGIYASLDLAKRSCEVNVEEWIASPPSDEDDAPRPQLHPVSWTLEPDPGLPEVFHANVPEDKYVWVGRYCDEQPTWYLKVMAETVHQAPAASQRPS